MVAWINAELEQPKDDNTVLVCKRLKSGKLSVGLGYYSAEFKDKYNGGWVCAGSTPVAYWAPIPKLPEEYDDP